MKRFAAVMRRAAAGHPAAAARRLWQRRRPEPTRRGRADAAVPYRVAASASETADTWTLELEPRRTGRLPPFAPGQFTMLYAFGVGEVPISVSGDPTRPGRSCTPCAPSARSPTAICARAARATCSACAGRSAPRGRSTRREGGDVVVVAGGIGLAPLRPAIHHAARAPRALRRAWSLLYGGPLARRAALPDELERWRGAARPRGRGHRRRRRRRLARRASASSPS